jgi:hypothetical protein
MSFSRVHGFPLSVLPVFPDQIVKSCNNLVIARSVSVLHESDESKNLIEQNDQPEVANFQ